MDHENLVKMNKSKTDRKCATCDEITTNRNLASR